MSVVRCLGSRPRPHALALRYLNGSTNLRRPFSSALSHDQKHLLKHLRAIKHPERDEDIVYMGLVKRVNLEDGVASVELDLDRSYRAIKKDCVGLLSGVPGIKEVKVSLHSPQKPSPTETAKPKTGLENVKSIIAVSSCKGGVGKSTVAVNLAYTLSRSGKSVGILDADIYGPSLPSLISPEDKQLYRSGHDMIRPLEYKGVKAMSYGFLRPSDDASATPAVLRGPMVSAIINDVALKTDWGELDYLIVDFPPGTGDIHITLSQQVPFTGAVVVTTPHRLSFADVVKGIDMFGKVKVPILGVVENMAYFQCSDCSKKHQLFGPSMNAQLQRMFGINNLHSFPLLPIMNQAGDQAMPSVLDPAAQSHTLPLYESLADSIVTELRSLSSQPRPAQVSYEKGQGMILSWPGEAERVVLDPKVVRLNCQCATCIDEFTGEQRLKPEDVPDDIYPRGMQNKGNYAVAVAWSDGHASSIYPHEFLLSLNKAKVH